MIGILNNREIDQVLFQQLYGRIGCHMGGRVYIVPLGYAYDGKFLYAHSMDGKKIELMRVNPDVCFQVDIVDDLANWRSVIAWGRFEELVSRADEKRAIQHLRDRFRPLHTSEELTQPPESHHAPQTVIKKERAVYFRIKLTEKTGRYERLTPALE